MTFIPAFIVLLLGTTLLQGCQDSPVSEALPARNLNGSVQLWDDKTNVLSDHGGVAVTIDGQAGIRATTNSTGDYVFGNLPYGTYTLSFTKEGIGTYRLFGLRHTDGTAPGDSSSLPRVVQLGKQSTTSITSFTLAGNTYAGDSTQTDGSGVTFRATISPAPSSASRAYIRHFLSTEPTVSSTNYTYASPLTALLSNNALSGFSKNALLKAGFKAGQTVYVRAYGDSFQSNQYVDPETGLRRFPNVNATSPPALSFVVPN